MTGFRNLCFTEYSIMDFLEKLDKICSYCEYIIFQVETCPDTGRNHLQGYLEFKEQHRQTKCKKILLKSTHFKARKGTQTQAIEYCRKADTSLGEEHRFEYGEARKQGERTDIEDNYRNFRSGHPISISSGVKYLRHFEYLRNSQIPERTEVPTSHIVFYDSKTTDYIDVLQYIRSKITKDILLKDIFTWSEDSENNGYIGQPYYITPLHGDNVILATSLPYKVRQLYLTTNFNSDNVILYTPYGHLQNKHIGKFTHIHKL